MKLRRIAAAATIAGTLLTAGTAAAAPAFAAPAHPATVHAVADGGAYYHSQQPS